VAKQIARLSAAALLALTAFTLIGVAGLPESNIFLDLQQTGALILAGKTLEGAPFSLSVWRGTPIILNFWASWCAPCRDELPALQALHEAGFRVVGVNVGELPQVAATFAAAYGVTFPNLTDADYYWLHVFQVRALPSTLFIAADGTIRERVSGGMSARELRAKAESLVKP
jgi:thiol-disulfide isomerase/thioredoxin